jgi:integrase
VADAYLKEHKHLRTADDIKHVLKKHIYPTFGERQVASIARSEVRKLQREIVKSSGDRIADHVVGIMRRIFAWYAADHDDFRNPIVRGIARVKPRERMRQRILTDDELRAVWNGAEVMGYPFGKMVQVLLLTACRRTEVAGMMRSERQGVDWIIPAKRHKSKRDFLLPLSTNAVVLLDALPVIGRKGFVFTLTGNASYQRYSAGKDALDEACGVRNWTLHDLRRTARSLMSRAGVDPDHAERALGHVIPGVRGVYDRYESAAEKRSAFEALAGQIRVILVNEPGKVVLLRQRD